MISISIHTRCIPITTSKTTIYLLFILLSNLIHSITPNPIAHKLWHQIGGRIGGNNQSRDDRMGYTVATSQNGNIIAIGSPLHSSFASPSSRIGIGRVSVYKNNEREDGNGIGDGDGDEWVKIGQDIEGDQPDDKYGQSISLNKEGNVIAIGAPDCRRGGKKQVGCVKVYELSFQRGSNGIDEDVWFQVGDTLEGSESFENFGYSIELGKDDTTLETFRIAIGAPGMHNSTTGYQVGKVCLYSFSWSENTSQNTKWKLESVIEDRSHTRSSSLFGSTISMTSDSKTIAIGAPTYGTNYQGAVKVYSQTSNNNEWVEINDIPSGISSHGKDDQCGVSVSIDSHGEILAYGCSNAQVGNKYQVGKVKILSKTIGDKGTIIWVTNEMTGQNEGDSFGKSLQLSASTYNNHPFLVIGAPNHNYNATVLDVGSQYTGLASIYYKTNNGNWEEAGLDINGFSSNDHMGSSVAINTDGHVVIAGAPNSGYARVFKLKGTAAPTQAPTSAAPTIAVTIVEENPDSVWIGFLICVSVLGLIFGTCVIMKKIRDKRFLAGGRGEDGDVQLGWINDAELI